MKQVIQNLRSGETTVIEVPIPSPQKGQALIRTAASLVSAGTERMLVEFARKSLVGKARSRPDLLEQVLDKARREGFITTVEAAFNRLDQPMAIGYSSAGTIVELGENMHGFQVGQRVACGGGGYAVHAEYAAVPRNLLAALPEDVSFESAAFTTLGAIALHGFRLARLQLGSRVAVIGLGLLGLLSAQISRAAGCSVLGIDLDPGRLDLARRLGIQAVLRKNAEGATAGPTDGQGFDAVLICADTPSNDPVELAGIIARDRAFVVASGAVGLEIPRKLYFEKELTFLNSRSYGPGRYDPAYEEGGQDYPIGYVRWTEGRNLKAFVELLSTGAVDPAPLITHRYPVDNAAEAYHLITGKDAEPFLGVLITYKGTQTSGTPLETTRKAPRSAKVEPSETAGSLPPENVRLGILGAGNFASAVMLPAVKKAPGIELVGIASASGLSAQNAANRYGFNYADSHEDRVINDPQVNTVAILTRHHMHAQQVLKSLQAGKNVFCEKPLAIKEEELAEIEQFILDENKESLSPIQHPLLLVGFNRRFAPLALKMKAFLAERNEPLAAYYRVNSGYIPADHWTQDPEQGGGRIIGEGCHFIDFLTFLTGQIPVSVAASALPDDGRYREDNAVLNFKYPDGSIGTVAYLANGDKTFPKEHVEVFCGGRIAQLNDFRSLELVYAGKRTLQRSRFRQDKGHQAEWEAFSHAVTSGGPPPIVYDQIFGVTRASFAAVQSLRSQERIDLT